MNWLRDLQEARDVERILEIVNGYLESQDEEFWTWIPSRARPSEVATEDDLHRWHQLLVQELAQSSSPPNIRMQDLCVIFLRASVRAHQINLREEKPDDSSNDTSFSARGRGRKASER